MWDTSPFRRLSDLKQEGVVPYQRVSMQMCMHGGLRDKKTDLLVSGSINFSSLGIMCDHSHSHLPWGMKQNKEGFATAEERNYPQLFCKRIARLVGDHFKVVAPVKRLPRDRSAAGVQARRSCTVLVPEYSKIINFDRLTGNEVEKSPKALNIRMSKASGG